MTIARLDPKVEAGMQLLILTPDQEVYEAAARLLRHSNWTIHRARNLAEARTKLASCVAVALCPERCEDGTWKDLLAEIRSRGCPVSLVVVDRQAREELWTEVLDGGGYDVLSYPFDAHELFRIVTQGWRHWNHLQKGLAQASAAAIHV